MVKVELVYVGADAVTCHLYLDVAVGTTAGQALEQSGIYDSYPEVLGLPVGIFSKKVELDTVLKAGDRIEIYRLLALDPKEKRRRQARIRK